MMKIWVDADACPIVIKEMLFRAVERTGVALILVANQYIRVPKHPQIKMIQVKSGFDIADEEIAKSVEMGDLVITADIPLAAEVIDKGALVLSPRGERLTQDNIRPRLNMRDFLDSMRASGVDTGGPSAMTQADRKLFAGHLDKWLSTLPAQ